MIFWQRLFRTRSCDAIWSQQTSGQRLPPFLYATSSPVENPISRPSHSCWSIAFLQCSRRNAEERLTLLRSLTLHSSWHVSSYRQTSCCSQSLSGWLTYINCHNMPWYTLSLIQVMTIKTVLTGVSALRSTQCYFSLTLRACVLPLRPFGESFIFLHSLVHGLPRCVVG